MTTALGTKPSHLKACHHLLTSPASCVPTPLPQLRPPAALNCFQGLRHAILSPQASDRSVLFVLNVPSFFSWLTCTNPLGLALGNIPALRCALAPKHISSNIQPGSPVAGPSFHPRVSEPKVVVSSTMSFPHPKEVQPSSLSSVELAQGGWKQF